MASWSGARKGQLERGRGLSGPSPDSKASAALAIAVRVSRHRHCLSTLHHQDTEILSRSVRLCGIMAMAAAGTCTGLATLAAASAAPTRRSIGAHSAHNVALPCAFVSSGNQFNCTRCVWSEFLTIGLVGFLCVDG